MNRYKCPVCGFGYSGPVKPLSCPVCNNEMLSYADYKLHIARASDNFCLSTGQPIADNQWLDDVSETKAWNMDEVDALVDREAFVHNLGVLLSQTREDVVKCTLIDRGDTVVITFKGGGRRAVNVHADSYAAIIRDVMKQV